MNNNVYANLLNLLMSGDIKPGQRLVQQDLAKRLGTTTTPLREALQRLEAEGIVEAISGFRGARLRSLNPDELAGEACVRRAIESEAVRICAQTADETEMSFLMSLAEKCDELLRAAVQDMVQIETLDYQFHFGIVKAGHCSPLEREFLRINIMKSFCHVVSGRSTIEPVPENHVAIAERLMARDEAGAVQAMRRHIDKVTEINVRYLREKELKEGLSGGR